MPHEIIDPLPRLLTAFQDQHPYSTSTYTIAIACLTLPSHSLYTMENPVAPHVRCYSACIRAINPGTIVRGARS